MRRPLFLLCLCLVVLAALRPAIYHMRDESVHKSIDIPDYETISATGRVCSKNTQSFIIDLSEVSYTAVSRETFPTKTKIICENNLQDEVMLGSTVIVQGTFREFRSATNPGEFDVKEYYHTQQIIGRMGDTTVVEQSDEYSELQEFLYRIRCYFKGRIYQIFPESEASVMTAMLLGDKEDLNDDIKELYKENGVIHILSISGLHITMIGMGIYRMLRRVGIPIGPATICGGGILCLYGIMTGMSVSACRAIGMYLIRMLGLMVGRTYDMLTALGVIAVIMIGQNPANLHHVGFLLSFGSILGISVLYPVLLQESCAESVKLYEPSLWKRVINLLWQEGKKKGKESIQAALAVTLFTLPIQLWFYYEIPVYSVLVNLLILPWMSLLMLTGMFAMLIPGTGIVGTATYYILQWYEWICECFEQLPNHTWNPGCPEVCQIVVYYTILLTVIVMRMRKKIISMFLLIMAVFVLTTDVNTDTRITFLDVGQGDGIVMELESGEVYIFDCGSTSRERIGKYVLIPYLKYRGIRKIDAIFLSHGDKDHCSGIDELLEKSREEGIIVEQLVVSQKADAFTDSEVPVSYLEVGDYFETKSASFLCLHPPGDYVSEDSNAGSQCIYAELKGVSVLLTGDIQGEGEKMLLAELKLRHISDITILKVAHHGSKNSTSEEFLAQTKPQVAIISCGRNNIYGHPHEEVLLRLEDQGSRVQTTPRYGAITVEIDRAVEVYGFIQ